LLTVSKLEKKDRQRKRIPESGHSESWDDWEEDKDEEDKTKEEQACVDGDWKRKSIAGHQP
jgi:hypothetical protein